MNARKDWNPDFDPGEKRLEKQIKLIPKRPRWVLKEGKEQ